MEHLQHYYDEHAQQARQHEDQRERVTNIILSIAGVLIGLITFSEFSLGPSRHRSLWSSSGSSGSSSQGSTTSDSNFIQP
jgi:hypothetical protein